MPKSVKSSGPPRVLLIFPPFWEPTAPYLSLPILAESLSRAGIAIRIWDLNIDLLRWYSGPAGSRAIEAALGQIMRSPRLAAMRQFAPLRRWSSTWRRAIADDHRSMERFFTHPETQVVRRPYRARTHLSRLGEIIAALTEAAARDPRVTLPHAGFILRRMQEELRWGPGVIGFSAPSQAQLIAAADLARLFHRLGCRAGMVVGGPAVTISFGVVFDPSKMPPAIDCCVIGPGEEALAELVRLRQEGRPWPRALRGGPPAAKDNPLPSYRSVPLGKYYGGSAQPLLYPFSEGCSWRRCRYCNLALIIPYRSRPARIVAGQLRSIGEGFKRRIFANIGSSIAPPHAERIAKAIRREGLKIRWETMARPERGWTAARCQACREGGLVSLHFGMESLSDRVLQTMNRGLSAAEQEAALAAAGEAGLAPLVFLILDHPGEEEADFSQTLSRIEPYLDRISIIEVTRFQLLHGSILGENPRAYHLHPAALPGSFLHDSTLEIPLRRSAGDLRRIRAKDTLLDEWIHRINQRHSLLFYRTPVKTSIVLDGRGLLMMGRDGDLIRRGYFLLPAILNRQYAIDPDRIQRISVGNRALFYSIRDQLRILPAASKNAAVLRRIEQGLSVGEALEACFSPPVKDLGAFNAVIQFVNTMDLLGGIVPR